MSTWHLALPMCRGNETQRYQMKLNLKPALDSDIFGSFYVAECHTPPSREMAALSWTTGSSLDLSWHLTCSWHLSNISLKLLKLPDDMMLPPSSLPSRGIASLPGACLKAVLWCQQLHPVLLRSKSSLLHQALCWGSFVHTEHSVSEPGPNMSGGVGIWAGKRIAGVEGQTWQYRREKGRAGNWEQSPHSCQQCAWRETSCSNG